MKEKVIIFSNDVMIDWTTKQAYFIIRSPFRFATHYYRWSVSEYSLPGVSVEENLFNFCYIKDLSLAVTQLTEPGFIFTIDPLSAISLVNKLDSVYETGESELLTVPLASFTNTVKPNPSQTELMFVS